MVRELAIFLYLSLYRVVFFLFSFFPVKEKTTFVVSFGDNSLPILEEINIQNLKIPVVVLCKTNKMQLFKDCHGIDLIPFETYNPFHWVRSIYHLATSSYILVDNYFGFLAAVHFKKGVQCIQLWHASGALKKFGLEDESVKNRSPRAIRRFLKVYAQFHKVVVGSDAMADIFARSFGLKKEQMIPSGVPRTDFFYNEIAMQKARKALSIDNKKVILYAPTYRDHEVHHFEIMLDLEKMAQKLGSDYVLYLRLHPAIRHKGIGSEHYPEFIRDVSSDQYGINELLAAADYLITDYSSIIVEYSLLKKPILFYLYDLEEYKKVRGVVKEFEHQLPGPIVKDTDSVIQSILHHPFDLQAVQAYSEKWNQYSNGHSSYNLVQYVFPERLK